MEEMYGSARKHFEPMRFVVSKMEMVRNWKAAESIRKNKIETEALTTDS